jgi:hypothetical protein
MSHIRKYSFFNVSYECEQERSQQEARPVSGGIALLCHPRKQLHRLRKRKGVVEIPEAVV